MKDRGGALVAGNDTLDDDVFPELPLPASVRTPDAGDGERRRDTDTHRGPTGDPSIPLRHSEFEPTVRLPHPKPLDEASLSEIHESPIPAAKTMPSRLETKPPAPRTSSGLHVLMGNGEKVALAKLTDKNRAPIPHADEGSPPRGLASASRVDEGAPHASPPVSIPRADDDRAAGIRDAYPFGLNEAPDGDIDKHRSERAVARDEAQLAVRALLETATSDTGAIVVSARAAIELASRLDPAHAELYEAELAAHAKRNARAPVVDSHQEKPAGIGHRLRQWLGI